MLSVKTSHIFLLRSTKNIQYTECSSISYKHSESSSPLWLSTVFLVLPGLTGSPEQPSFVMVAPFQFCMWPWLFQDYLAQHAPLKLMPWYPATPLVLLLLSHHDFILAQLSPVLHSVVNGCCLSEAELHCFPQGHGLYIVKIVCYCACFVSACS